MTWAGGGAIGGRAQPVGSPGGLPFAGVPPEVLDRIDAILASEPRHAEPEVEFSASDFDRRPLTLRRFMAPFKWALLGAFLLVVVETIALRIGPLLTQLAIDRGMGLGSLGDGPTQTSRDFLIGIFVAYVGFVVLALVVSRLRMLWTGTVGERLLYALRVRVFSHFQNLSLGFFTKEKKGVLISRMTSDIEHLQALFHEGIVQLVVQALTLMVLGAQLFVFSPRLAVITLVFVAPVMLLMTRWFQMSSDRGYLAVRDRLADVLADLSESLAGIRVVSAHNRQRHNTIRHANVVGAYRNANDYTAKVNAIYGPGSETVGNMTLVLALLIGGRMVLGGDLQVGQLVGFMLALATFFAPVQQLAQLYNAYQQGQAGITKLRQVLLTPPAVPDKPDAYDLGTIGGHIAFEGVTFGYDPAEPVLHDTSFEIRPGETFSLVGATGAGKSTIAKLVIRFYDPDEGRVLVDGHDLRDLRLESVRRQLGVVPQEPYLFDGTIRDNIAFARPDATDEEILEAARAVGLDSLLARLPDGIHTPVHERGSSLASGERQLLALARAFLVRPRVIVLDEATSNLDPQSEEQVERGLDVLLEGRTAIIIAHRLATAMRADRIAVVDQGRIVELGSHDDLVARGGLYADLYATWRRHARGRPDVDPSSVASPIISGQ